MKTKSEQNTEKKVYGIEQVANYIIHLANQQFSEKPAGSRNATGGNAAEGEDLASPTGITHLKLQKILYFAQAYYLGGLSRPLFEEEIEAWQYGPVIREIYTLFSPHGNSLISETTVCPGGNPHSEILPKDQQILKEKIWDNYGRFSAWYLVESAHSHDPWKDAWEKNGQGQNGQIIIPKKTIQKYYGTQ